MIRLVVCLLIVACCQISSAAERTFKKQQLSDKFFAEGACFGDINHDGKPDVVAGPFWFAGPDFTEQHAFYPPVAFDPLGYSDNFSSFTHDINGDGWTDILVIPFPGKEGYWFANPQGKDGNWDKHVYLAVVDNESPTFTDITGDGKPEVICSTDGYFGYAAPGVDPTQPWTFHRVSDQSAGGKFTHGLGVGDVNGDGRKDLLEKNGWWEQPASLAGDPVWKKHAFPFSEGGGAHMYAEDLNGDGRNDVITSLQAHGYGLVWYEQLPGDGEPKFKPHLITGTTPEDNETGLKFSQLHAIDFVDMDGDGLKDIVTGKRWWAHGPKGDPEPNEAAVLYWFQRVPGPDQTVSWKAHQIDNDSGVSTQVMAGDVTGDKLPDVIVGNKKGIFVHRQVAK
ncbi:MAG: VCBS repeat-containing protein [Planctomycetaceae bacterium]